MGEVAAVRLPESALSVSFADSSPKGGAKGATPGRLRCNAAELGFDAYVRTETQIGFLDRIIQFYVLIGFSQPLDKLEVFELRVDSCGIPSG